MVSIESQISTQDTHFNYNRTASIIHQQQLHQLLERVSQGGGARAVDKHVSRGKLMARQRIDRLVDRDTPFFELSALAANGMYDDQFPGAGIVTGIGFIHHRPVMIVANDATVKGGTYVAETIKKHLRAQQIALDNHLPCIYLVDSGGVFLPEQANVFPDKTGFGSIFYNQARMSAHGIAQIAVVMGSCTAGGAYIPAMSDETIIVRHQGTIFLAGPPLVKAATGETVTDQELGGADVHTRLSGVADHVAENDVHALHICRNIIESMPTCAAQSNGGEVEPLYPVDDIYGLIPTENQPAPDVREIIARLVDGSLFHEFKPDYGTTLVTGFARINGCEVGVLANNGVLFGESAQKGAHFIQLCNARHIPMLFLQNITGFIVGKEYEHRGIAKDGAKMVNALANATVPFITVVIGGSYGAGNYAMGGRSMNPRLLLMWPNARIGVMGARQAAEVLTTVKRDQLMAAGKPIDESLLDETQQSVTDSFTRESSAYYSTARLWDDGIIDPAQTRQVLSFLFPLLKNEPQTQTYGVFRM